MGTTWVVVLVLVAGALSVGLGVRDILRDVWSRS